MEAEQLLSNEEKARLVECPGCGTDYGLGESVRDRDGNCMVTCGYCGQSVHYQISWVE